MNFPSQWKGTKGVSSQRKENEKLSGHGMEKYTPSGAEKSKVSAVVGRIFRPKEADEEFFWLAALFLSAGSLVSRSLFT